MEAVKKKYINPYARILYVPLSGLFAAFSSTPVSQSGSHLIGHYPTLHEAIAERDRFKRERYEIPEARRTREMRTQHQSPAASLLPSEDEVQFFDFDKEFGYSYNHDEDY